MSNIRYNQKTSLGHIIVSDDRNFYDSLRTVKKEGAEIISLKEIDELQYKNEISDRGIEGMVKEAVFYNPKDMTMTFLRENPLFDEAYANKASELFETRREDLNFDREKDYFTELIQEDKLKAPNLRRALTMGVTDTRYIKLSQNLELAKFLFENSEWMPHSSRETIIYVPFEHDLRDYASSFVAPISYMRGNELSAVCSIRAPIIGIIKAKKSPENTIKPTPITSPSEKVANTTSNNEFKDDFNYEHYINNVGSLK